jgi:hypothetical protein
MKTSPLRYIHADETFASGLTHAAIEYWRKQTTREIVESLRPGRNESLKVKSDGRILNGNVRVRVLEERGYDIHSLEREAV